MAARVETPEQAEAVLRADYEKRWQDDVEVDCLWENGRAFFCVVHVGERVFLNTVGPRGGVYSVLGLHGLWQVDALRAAL